MFCMWKPGYPTGSGDEPCINLEKNAGLIMPKRPVLPCLISSSLKCNMGKWDIRNSIIIA